jgi:O-antigen ligase
LSVVQRLRLSRSVDRLTILRMTHPGLRPGWSLLGFLLVGGLAVVAWSVQRRTQASSAPVVMLVVSSVGALVVAAFIGGVHRALVPLAVALAVSYLALNWSGDLFANPLSGPFGYRNAFGALLFQGALAWIIAGIALHHPVTVALSFVPATMLAVLAVRSSSATAAGCALLFIVALALFGRRWTRVAISLCALAAAAVLVGTIWLGAIHDPARPLSGLADRIADAGITERRLSLWHDALTIAGRHPWGIGHGRFRTMSPTAIADRDATFAHNEYLERNAELGWLGMTLTILLVAWAFVRLAVNPHADIVTAVSAAALAGLSIHACVDYVWHFPAVVLAGAALVGTGVAMSGKASGPPPAIPVPTTQS